jgi:hypothetical protein
MYKTIHTKLHILIMLLSSLSIAGCHAQNETILFDGEKLGYWKITDFAGQGDVYIENGSIYLEKGDNMTGITWIGPLLRTNYEISLEAMRVSGSDFFCGLTFPVGDSSCTLILGGWGGELCGLSSIDSFDASENETTRFISFENGRWYHVLLRVGSDRIEARLDNQQIVNITTTGRDVDIRIEVVPSQPLGIATWRTTGAVRNIRLQKLEN